MNKNTSRLLSELRVYVKVCGKLNFNLPAIKYIILIKLLIFRYPLALRFAN